MKIKYKNLEAELGAEDIAKKIIDNNEKDWKEKFDSKSETKKELLKIKHQNKMEEQLVKKMDQKDLKKYYKGQKQSSNVKDQDYDMVKSKKIFNVLSIIMFFIYGLFCILGFQNHHIVSAIISLIQILLTIISFLISMNFFQFFKNDYKLFLIISFLLIVPWLTFAV